MVLRKELTNISNYKLFEISLLCNFLLSVCCMYVCLFLRHE